MLAGCGPSFEVGDEAWVELPGASPLWDEYAIVEVRSFSDGQARVELVERIRVLDHLEGRVPWFKRRNARELLSRLEGGEPAWVAEDDLMAPEDGELDAEAKREIFRQGLSWVWLGAEGLGKDFSTLPSPEGVEEALALAGRRGLDDEARALELTIELLDIAAEAFAGYEAPDAAIEGADAVREFADAVREGAGVVRERIADDPLAGRRLLNAMANDQAKLWRDIIGSRRSQARTSREAAVMGAIFGSSSRSGSEAELPRELEAIVGSWEWHAASTAIDLLVLLKGELASALERQMNLAESADEAVDAAAAVLEAAEGVADLVTMDGGRRFRDESRREIVERSERSLALAAARSAFQAADGEAAEGDSTDPAEAAEALLGRARGFASGFDGTLDLEPVWGEVETEHHKGAAGALESEVRAALNEPDLRRASIAMARYLSASRTLGSLHARHDRKRLNGASAGKFAESQGRRLAGSVQYRLRPAAEAFLGTGSHDFDSAAHGERLPRLRALMEPFDAALGEEALDERFFRETGEVAKANDNRRLLGVGQVWTGALLCGEATRYQRYRQGASRYGSRYHGPERLALTLELTEEAEGQGQSTLYQGLLTAQNLPDSGTWRERNPQTGEWARTARPESTQFVVVTYDPRDLAVSLRFGAVDRAAHVERHGDESYVRGTEGDWQRFNGSGRLDPSKPAISGRIDRRWEYIDRTCSEFALSPSGPARSEPRAAVDDGQGPSEGSGAGGGSAGDGQPQLSGLAEQTYLGGMKKRGMKVFALSADGEWCGPSVTLKIEAESGDVFSDGTADFYMRRFGERINDADFCPPAKVAEIVGFAGAGPDPCFSGRAEADEWRIVSGGGGAQCD